MKNTIARFFSNAATPKSAQVGGEPLRQNKKIIYSNLKMVVFNSLLRILGDNKKQIFKKYLRGLGIATFNGILQKCKGYFAEIKYYW